MPFTTKEICLMRLAPRYAIRPIGLFGCLAALNCTLNCQTAMAGQAQTVQQATIAVLWTHSVASPDAFVVVGKNEGGVTKNTAMPPSNVGWPAFVEPIGRDLGQSYLDAQSTTGKKPFVPVLGPAFLRERESELDSQFRQAIGAMHLGLLNPRQPADLRCFCMERSGPVDMGTEGTIFDRLSRCLFGVDFEAAKELDQAGRLALRPSILTAEHSAESEGSFVPQLATGLVTQIVEKTPRLNSRGPSPTYSAHRGVCDRFVG
jgi:hypothetical protein